ncbi:Fpg/Nei family DNA glycosylase [Mucilaginibacter daejeonensis]|uniref:DNA-formamidopyrimidine glycosylase family protein n=1 Tax=Mucilaginibacter daejeonensis TaxID=398049 RepID=UPI001D17C033|nr:DNA-formamidopyrimidine glycosylase family protein [Mucilaginibacter daejeonensis]UEG51797.1 Fpg/Nei family DNA glycosylase [Mucilaginibacter daejeonensis]
MPELPDLEVFSRNLTKVLKNKELVKVSVSVSKKLNISSTELANALEGSKLNRVVRTGKQLRFDLNNGHSLGLHLMLHGELHWFEKQNDHKHTILELLFEGDKGLAVTDFQKAATPTLDPDEAEVPDALDDAVDVAFWQKTLQKSKKQVKVILMDQKVIRGIGNAYADEILYDAGISPFAAANTIPDRYIKELDASIKNVLNNAIKQILDKDPDIITGEVRDFLCVHRPKQKTTPKGETILVGESGGRKTYYTEAQKTFDQ